MKVGFFNRLIFILAALIILVVSVVMMMFSGYFEIFHSFSFNSMSDIVMTAIDNLYHEEINFIPATVGIFIALIVCIWLFVLAFRKNKTEKTKPIEYIKIGSPESGQIKIATSTINNMICKNIDEITGVKNSRAKTNVIDDKAFVVVGVSVEDGVIIPKVCEEIQTTTKEKIQQITGLVIEEINILVNNKS